MLTDDLDRTDTWPSLISRSEYVRPLTGVEQCKKRKEYAA